MDNNIPKAVVNIIPPKEIITTRSYFNSEIDIDGNIVEFLQKLKTFCEGLENPEDVFVEGDSQEDRDGYVTGYTLNFLRVTNTPNPCYEEEMEQYGLDLAHNRQILGKHQQEMERLEIESFFLKHPELKKND